MLTTMVKGYDGQEIVGAGGRDGVFAAFDWRQMTLRPGPGITKKANVPSDGLSAFAPEHHAELTRILGHYSDVQSINSEDTVTWSAFGSSPGDAWLCTLLDDCYGKCCRPSEWEVALWKTTAHPDGRGHRPEADVIADAVGTLGRYVFEAKWTSDIGEGQGKGGTKTQIDMRFFAAGERGANPEESGVIVIVPSPSRYFAKNQPVFRRYFDVKNGAYVPRMDRLAAITWERIADIMGGEVRQYLEWRLSRLPRV